MVHVPFLLLMKEILQQLVGSVSQYLHGFPHPRWFFRDFWTINSILVYQSDLHIPPGPGESEGKSSTWMTFPSKGMLERKWWVGPDMFDEKFKMDIYWQQIYKYNDTYGYQQKSITGVERKGYEQLNKFLPNKKLAISTKEGLFFQIVDDPWLNISTWRTLSWYSIPRRGRPVMLVSSKFTSLVKQWFHSILETVPVWYDSNIFQSVSWYHCSLLLLSWLFFSLLHSC